MKNKLEINSNHIRGESSNSLKDAFKETIKLVSVAGVIISVPIVFCRYLYNYDLKAVDIPKPLDLSINQQVDMMFDFGGNDLNYVTKADARKMKKLRLDLTEGDMDLSFLENFENLGELELIVDHESWDFIKSMPELQKLGSLKLYNRYATTQTALSMEHLEFLKGFPNLKSLELNLASTIIPARAVEEFCPDLEKITISNWRQDNILTDFGYFQNLKEFEVRHSSAKSVALAFSRDDYKKLIDKGVFVSINTKTSIQDYWEECERYYNNLNLSNCRTKKDIVDKILIGMSSGEICGSEQLDVTRTLRALTHMAGIESKYVQGPSQSFCLIDIFGTNTYYEFNPQLILQNNDAISLITNGQINNILGYMQEVDTDNYYIKVPSGNKNFKK